MPLPSGGGSAFFLLSLHARAACDESLRCSSVGSLRSPSRFHSDTCASSSAHTHTHTHTHHDYRCATTTMLLWVLLIKSIGRTEVFVRPQSPCWSITLKSYTMREPCQTMIIADFVFAMGLTKNLLLATFLKCFVLTNIFAHIVENGYTVSCDKRTFVNWTHGNVKTNGRGQNMSNAIFWIFPFG